MSLLLALVSICAGLLLLLFFVPWTPQVAGAAGTSAAPRCPRTHAPAEHVARLRLDDRCYEISTCTPECALELQRLAESSSDAFRRKYECDERGSERPLNCLRLQHHITRQPAQVAREVSC